MGDTTHLHLPVPVSDPREQQVVDGLSTDKDLMAMAMAIGSMENPVEDHTGAQNSTYSDFHFPTGYYR